MNTKNWKYFLTVTLLAISLAACAESAASLEGTAWKLADFAGKSLVANTQPTLSFKDGLASGNSTCNTYSGEFKVQGDNIEFGMMMSTMMACADTAAMDQEQEYLAFLGSVERWELSGGQLFLFNAAGDVLVFDSQN